jgi:hypothetical protein
LIAQVGNPELLATFYLRCVTILAPQGILKTCQTTKEIYVGIRR